MIQLGLLLRDVDQWQIVDSIHVCPECGLKVNLIHKEYFPEHYEDQETE